LGADLVVFVDADEFAALSDGATVSTLTNYGSGPNFTKTGGDNGTKQTDSGLTVVQWGGSNNFQYESASSISAMSAWTMYAIVKSSDTASRYFLTAGDGNHAIIAGFTGGKWEYYDTPR